MSPRVRYASEFTTSGYSVAALRCLQALHGVGVDVCWQPLVDLVEGRVVAPPGTPLPADLAALQRDREEGETLVLHSVPKGWHLAASDLRPTHLIGHSVWEADVLPARWRIDMGMVDEIWVPTEWNQRSFADALGVPVHVVPHVASTVDPAPPPLELSEDVFVIASVAAWDWRKRPDLAIAAYAQAFTKADPVVLVVKTTPWPIAWPSRQRIATVAHIADVLRAFPDHGRVVVDTGPWTEAEVLGLLGRADCFLSLTAAEGWGLGAFDAACLGTPVVMTGHGGQLAWLGADHPGLVPFRMVEAEHPDRTLFEPGMTWAAAEVDTAAEMLRALHRGELPALTRATSRLAAELPDRYSPERIGALAAALLPT